SNAATPAAFCAATRNPGGSTRATPCPTATFWPSGGPAVAAWEDGCFGRGLGVTGLDGFAGGCDGVVGSSDGRSGPSEGSGSTAGCGDGSGASCTGSGVSFDGSGPGLAAHGSGFASAEPWLGSSDTTVSWITGCRRERTATTPMMAAPTTTAMLITTIRLVGGSARWRAPAGFTPNGTGGCGIGAGYGACG